MDAYIEAGGNFVDTANIYTKGHSEKIIGDHLGKNTAKRDRLVIATKFMGNLFNGDPNGGGAGRKSIIAACEESLRRLQTDFIDLYWLHFWDHLTPIEETMRALDDLVTSGKVRYIGFSDTPAWKCAEAQTLAGFRGFSPIIALQIEYSLLQRTAENELLPMAGEMGMGVTPWSPLKYGVLSGKYTRANKDTIEPGRGERLKEHLTDRNLDIVEKCAQIAAEVGATTAQVALAWVQGREGVTSTIIGVRTMAQLTNNLGALDVVLTGEHIAVLDAASAIEPIFPQNFLPGIRTLVHGGTTIDGESCEPWPMAPTRDEERW